ncbi:glutamate receptor 3.4 isoform X1 [Cryptomeria japonica]|uniref:glutamate receptor 3.4 isoform X1 n=1 Tax=Cryptomeria japonica TaxID=3369 RepID=UPI0027DA97BA|nr:glutamate receptor 3.4 isoform X1 [Cryptomeria japonica]
MLQMQCLQYFLVLFMNFLLFSIAIAFPLQHQSHPSTIKVGALLSLNSTIGRISKTALEFAVERINQEQKLLPGTKIALKIMDYNCNTSQGVAAAMKLLEEEVVAIIGPQTSSVVQSVAKVAEAVHVPLVSFSATDPLLSGKHYPYFTRVVFNDDVQMTAVANIIGNHGWKEAVVLFTDDNLGWNAIDFLSGALEPYRCKIVYKVALHPNLDMLEIHHNLIRLRHIKSKVFVVHVQPNFGHSVLSAAHNLSLFDRDHVWIVTDAITRTLDAVSSDVDLWKEFHGIVGARSYMPMSSKLKSVQYELRSKLGDKHATYRSLQAYGFYAYDAIWTVAKALHDFLGKKRNLTFTHASLHASASGRVGMAKFKVFENGHFLLNEILNVKFSGATGLVKLDTKGERVGTCFEVVKFTHKKLRIVGKWKEETGYYTILSDVNGGGVGHRVFGAATGNQSVSHDIWSRRSSKSLHDWYFQKYSRPLRVAFPKDAIQRGLVSITVDRSNITNFHGFFIDVFEAAIAYLPYNVSYTFIPVGNGSSTLNLDYLLEKVADQEYDVAIGDIPITPARLQRVDFTQPYVTAGLVVVVRQKDYSSKKAWSFLEPFTPGLWFTMLAFVIFTGLVVWVLEHRKNKKFQGKRLKQQVGTSIWFSFSTLFFAQSEKVKSIRGRIVVIVWLFVILIVTSSYTANLTLLLTVDQIKPDFQGISEVLASGVPIGFQAGSYAGEFLNKLGLTKDRLVPLQNVSSYTKMLYRGPKSGGVGAIVDDLPHAQLFWSSQCEFKTYSQQFTSSGWGFAFQKGSKLTVDVSTAILGLEENGELQQIHEKWFGSSACDSTDSTESNHLGLDSFWGLFLITGLVSLTSVILYFRNHLFYIMLKICRRDLSMTTLSI